jgi:hypothetical protein
VALGGSKCTHSMNGSVYHHCMVLVLGNFLRCSWICDCDLIVVVQGTHVLPSRM